MMVIIRVYVKQMKYFNMISYKSGRRKKCGDSYLLDGKIFWTLTQIPKSIKKKNDCQKRERERESEKSKLKSLH